MTQSPEEIELEINRLVGLLAPKQARLLATDLCESVLEIANGREVDNDGEVDQGNLCRQMFELAKQRANGSPPDEMLATLREKSTRLYDSTFHHPETPTAQTLALAAFGEAAFTDDALTALKNVSHFVASALATLAGEHAKTVPFDTVYDSVFVSVKKRHLEDVRQATK